jgi:hypothetical protein
MELTKYLQEEKQLDVEMEKIWDSPYFDGITDYEKYSNANIKILWILKEPNGKDGESRNHRDFHKHVSCYPLWMSTFGNIMRVSYALLRGINNYLNIPLINKKEGTINGEVVLDRIAIINVNKSGGEHISNQAKLNKEYERKGVKEFLSKQIDFIDPQIIINSHLIEKFFQDQAGNNKIQMDGKRFIKNGKRLSIFMGHPNRKEKQGYCNEILRIVSNHF